MLEENGGLESIVSFLTDETFLKKNLKSFMKTFGRDKERVLKLLIANLTSLSQVELFGKKLQELDLIEIVSSLIRNNKEITSDLEFSANLFLSKSNSDYQSENVFDAIPTKIKDYLKKCVVDFDKKNQNDLDKSRKKRDLIFGKKIFENHRFYALDIDSCGMATTLNVILDSLASLASKNTKKKNFKSLIYTELKRDLDIVLEKGSTGEKRLVLEIYKHLACDQEIRQKFILSEEIKTSILKSDDYEEILKTSFRNLLYFLGQNCETKESVSHDGPRNKSDLILLVFNWTNEEQFGELEKKLVGKSDYRVKSIDIEGMLNAVSITIIIILEIFRKLFNLIVWLN
jgi:hypothetical protein